MLYTAIIINARPNTDKPAARPIQVPVHQFPVDAPDAKTARAAADAAAPVWVDAFGKPDAAYITRVHIDADAAPMDAARDIAYNVLATTYSRQALDFVRQAMDSIAVHDETPDAADIISECAAALFDADAAAAIAARPTYADAPDALKDAPAFFRRRAAYAAANVYVKGWKKRAARTAKQDISDYFRHIDDADADARAAAEFEDGYFAPALDADADADAINAAMDARREFVKNRRAARRYIAKAFDAMTPRQRDAMRAYAGNGNMRAAAAAMGVKSVATIAEHISKARRAINESGIARAIIADVNAGIQPADAAAMDARRRRTICAARHNAAADAARAAARFGNDAAAAYDAAMDAARAAKKARAAADAAARAENDAAADAAEKARAALDLPDARMTPADAAAIDAAIARRRPHDADAQNAAAARAIDARPTPAIIPMDAARAAELDAARRAAAAELDAARAAARRDCTRAAIDAAAAAMDAADAARAAARRADIARAAIIAALIIRAAMDAARAEFDADAARRVPTPADIARADAAAARRAAMVYSSIHTAMPAAAIDARRAAMA